MNIRKVDVEELLVELENAKSFSIYLEGEEFNFNDIGLSCKELVRQIREGSDVYNVQGIKILRRLKPCWCCGRFRYGFDDDYEVLEGVKVEEDCKYWESKECKPDGKCQGKDSWKNGGE